MFGKWHETSGLNNTTKREIHASDIPRLTFLSKLAILNL